VPDLRREQIQHLREAPLDVLIIGGGINGAGILRDLTLRSRHPGVSLRTGLIEKAHFAAGASGKNSQLIHGGLRYLKYLQVHLVRESLRERSTLLRIAPRFVRPLEFLLPMYGLKSRLMYGTGLWLYDRLAGSQAIARHRTVAPQEATRLEPGLSPSGLNSAALFYDATVYSARFVVENVLDAIGQGGFAANYVGAETWERGADRIWRVQCLDTLAEERFELRARKLVDARGAWLDGQTLRLVRGSHIVLPRLTSGDRAIAHFEPSGRIVFFIPWGSRNQLTLVGTTEVDHTGSPERVHISQAEAEYLLGIVGKLFPGPKGAAPISAFSSLRPLVRAQGGSATSVSRGHKIWNTSDGILDIAGGKYTTYRLMSEEAADLICREIAPELANVHRTAEMPLPHVDRAIGDAMEQHLRDYFFVTTYLGYERQWTAESLRPYAEALAAKRHWSGARVQQEIQEFAAASPAGL
jgi:glycerol-3-phosphate dehydrogenase